MKNLLLFSLVIFLNLTVNAQNQISITIINAEYKADSKYLNLKLEIKNNTDSLLYIINPRHYYFNLSDSKSSMRDKGLYEVPYELIITSNKKCNKEVEEFLEIESDQVSQTQLIPDLEKILPKKTRKFYNIKISRRDYYFCEKLEYKIQIKYKPDFYIIKEDQRKELRTQFNILLAEIDKLNKTAIYDLDMKEGLSCSKSSKLYKFGKMLNEIPAMTKLCGQEFISNEIIANQIE